MRAVHVRSSVGAPGTGAGSEGLAIAGMEAASAVSAAISPTRAGAAGTTRNLQALPPAGNGDPSFLQIAQGTARPGRRFRGTPRLEGASPKRGSYDRHD